MIEEVKEEIKIINGIETTFYGNKKNFIKKETTVYYSGRTHAYVTYYDTFEEAVHSLDKLLEALKIKDYGYRDIETKLDTVNKIMVLKFTSDPDDIRDITYNTYEIYAIGE